MGSSYHKMGSIVWLCLCIVFAFTGAGNARDLKQYEHEAPASGLKRNGSTRWRFVLVLPMQSKREELSSLSLTQTAWQLGWFFVDVTGTGSKGCVVDGNTAQRQRNLQRPDIFFVAPEISKWVRNVFSPVCHIRARGRLSACVFADHLSHLEKKRRLRAACSVMTAHADLSEVLFHLSKSTQGTAYKQII